MQWQVLIPAFTLGAAGSLHCIGMCGPLSLALPTYHLSKTMKLFSLGLYQMGRIITYSFLGILAGLVGRSIYITGLQQWFSILAGAAMLLIAVPYFLQNRQLHFGIPGRFYFRVQKLTAGILASAKGPFGFLLLGMANGLLPCGMVYISLAAAVTLPGIGEGAAFMALFGAGTLPAMMLVAYAGHVLKPGLRHSFRKAIPVFTTLMGVVLILRGMNLGIPFLSPGFAGAHGGAISCHP